MKPRPGKENEDKVLRVFIYGHQRSLRADRDPDSYGFTIPTVATVTGLHPATVRLAVERLVQQDWLNLAGEVGKANLYILQDRKALKAKREADAKWMAANRDIPATCKTCGGRLIIPRRSRVGYEKHEFWCPHKPRDGAHLLYRVWSGYQPEDEKRWSPEEQENARHERERLSRSPWVSRTTWNTGGPQSTDLAQVMHLVRSRATRS